MGGAYYFSLGQTYILYAASLVLIGAKAKILCCFGWNFWNVLTTIHIIWDNYIKAFCWLEVFQSLVVNGIVKEYLLVMLMSRHSHRVAQDQSLYRGDVGE